MGERRDKGKEERRKENKIKQRRKRKYKNIFRMAQDFVIL